MAPEEKTSVEISEEPKSAPRESENTAQAAPAQETSAPDKSSDQPALTVSQGSKDPVLRLEELKGKQYQGALTIDEANELANLQKQQDAQGLTKQKRDNRKRKKVKPQDFKPDDVINYMYEQWLLKLFTRAGAKIEEVVTNGAYKLEDLYYNKLREKASSDTRYAGTNACKNSISVSDMLRQTRKNLDQRSSGQLDEINRLSKLIGEGKMSSASATDLLALCKCMNIPASEAQNNPQIKAIVQDSLVYKEKREAVYKNLGLTPEEVEKNPYAYKDKMNRLKDAPDKSDLYQQTKTLEKEMAAAKTNLAKHGMRFSLQQTRNLTYDTFLDHTALMMSAAQITDKNARDGNAFAGKDIKEVFSATLESNRATLREATAEEKKAYVSGQKTTNKGLAINGYYQMAQMAHINASHAVNQRKIAEMDAKTPANKSLDRLIKMVNEQRKTQQMPDMEQVEKSVQAAKEEKRQFMQESSANAAPNTAAGAPRDLREEAADEQSAASSLQARSDKLQQKRTALKQREDAHNNSPIAARLSRFKDNIKSKAKEAYHNHQIKNELGQLNDLVKNNFNGFDGAFIPKGRYGYD